MNRPDPIERAILHIGWPKTATTSFQFMLGQAWPNLAGKPFDRPGGKTANAILRELTFGTDPGPGLLDALFAASRVEPQLPVICSHEPFAGGDLTAASHPGNDVVAERLCRSSWSLDVVVTIREARAMLRSRYLHRLRDGDPRSYRDYLRAVHDDPAAGVAPGVMSSTIASYESLLGSGRVRVLRGEDVIRRPVETFGALGGAFSVPELAPVGRVAVPHLNQREIFGHGIELVVNRSVLPVDPGAPAHHIREAMRRDVYTPIRRRLRGRLPDVDVEPYFAHAEAIEEAFVTELRSEHEELFSSRGVIVPEPTSA